MDGTTAGQIGLAPLGSLPLPQNPALSGVPPLNPVPVAQPVAPIISMPSPTMPVPVIPPVVPTVAPVPPMPVVPQYSQPTPVYAPSLTTAPIVNAPTLSPPIPPMPPVVVAPPALVQLPPVISAEELGLTPPGTMTPELHLQQIENQIAEVDLDLMAETKSPTATMTTAVPSAASPIPPIVPPMPPAPKPAAPVAPAPTSMPVVSTASNYFQNTGSKSSKVIQSDVPIERGSAFSAINGPLLKKIGIIVGAVVVLGVAGYLIFNGVTSSQKSNNTTTTKTTPTVTPSGSSTSSNVPDTTAIPGAESTTGTTTTTTPVVDAPSSASQGTTVVQTPAAPAPAQTPTAPVTTPTTPNTGLNDDDVARLPRYLTITKLGIHASVEKIGITNSGQMGAPNDIWNAGWYTGSAAPGSTGTAFLDGHATSKRGALFGNLDTLRQGDIISVERNDGRVINYQIRRVKVVSRHDVNMASMLQSFDATKNGLNIMSCVGNWVASEQTLENRVLVYATQTP